MYRCKDCKTIYKDKVDYCDCGNNVFEEIPNEPLPVLKEYPEEEVVPVKPRPIIPLNLLSVFIFSACCVFSLCFVLFLGPAPKKREKLPNTTQKTVVKDIPDISKIWDDTPSYKVIVDLNADYNSYKNGLRNALLTRLNTDGLEGAGSCDVQFILDRHGNLKKKKLYQNTANKPLIDAAKKMLSSVKNYNPPPASYDGNPITLELAALDNKSYALKYKD